jgi:tetratricopeptide (TPR) repeat protein
MLQIAVLVVVVGGIAWLLVYMRAQKPATGPQTLIHQHRYADAVAAADRILASSPDDSATWLHRAEALKLLGNFQDAITSYEHSSDPAAREGIALSLAHLGRDLDRAKQLMEQTIALHPQIQEFQALALSYVLLQGGDRDAALRTYRDNAELLETRFRDDYTDPDPLLAETLWMFAELAAADGDEQPAQLLRARAAQWAPGSVWARSGAA